MALNLLLRPSGKKAAHVTARGRERAPFSQAVRVLLKTPERPVLVESIWQNSDGSFTGEMHAPKSDSTAAGGPAGRELVQFREEHVFTYETAEDLVRRGMAPETLDVVQQFDRSKFHEEQPKSEAGGELSEFHFDTSLWDQPAPPPQALAIEQVSPLPMPPPNPGLRSRQRVPKRMMIGAVCVALIVGAGMGFILGHKSDPLRHAVQPQVGEPANLRLDYDLKKR